MDSLPKAKIQENFDALCIEIKGTAIAKTAKADDSFVVDFLVFEKQAAQRSLYLTEKLVENI